jgi:hypothetical protein
MAGYLIDDARCAADTVFVGNVKLAPYTESKDFAPCPHATAELIIDVLASPDYLHARFRDIALVLQIASPSDARFVEHSARNNFRWGTLVDGAWLESAPGPPTCKLRLRTPCGSLLSGPGNGLSHRMGLHGVCSCTTLDIRAVVTAKHDGQPVSSCPLVIRDLAVGTRISGYMK